MQTHSAPARRLRFPPTDGLHSYPATPARYEQEKAAWDAANPGARPEARDAAMRRIARRLGV